MLPVTLSLLGLGLRPITWLFMKWFGPRGLASVLFTLVALEELESGLPQMPPLVQVATSTILLSVGGPRRERRTPGSPVRRPN